MSRSVATLLPVGPAAASGRVRIAPHLGVYDLGVEGTVLLSERGSAVLHGPLAHALVGLADGTRDRLALEHALVATGDVTDADASDAVEELLLAGVLDETPDATDDASGLIDGAEDVRATGFWQLCGLAPATPVRRDSTTVVSLVSIGAVDAAAVSTALLLAGVDARLLRPGDIAADTGERPGTVCGQLFVVVTDDYAHPALQGIARRLRVAGRRWLLVRPVGSQMLLGPVFGAAAANGSTDDSGQPCYACLAHRVRGQRTTEQYLDRRVARGDDGSASTSIRPTAPIVDTPATRLLGAGLLAAAVTAVLAGSDTFTSTVVSLDCISLSTQPHTVRRRPQCPECGDPTVVARRMGEPVVLRDTPATARSDSGYRTRSSNEMVAAYGDLVSPITGVVPSLHRLTDPDASVPVYVAGANRAVRTTSLAGLRSGLRAMSSGKGTSDTQARASAIGESLERHSGVYTGEEPSYVASFNELATHRIDAIHPVTLQGFSDRQYAERDRWNAFGVGPMAVPLPFDDDRPVAWSPAWSLTDRRQVLLPTAFLFYAADVPGASMVVADSNGAAAGTSIEDATLQGLCELIERDAVAQWWYNRLARPSIDLDTCDGEWVGRLRAEHARLGRQLWALDLTSDLGVPVVVAVSRRAGGSSPRDAAGSEDILLSFGAHPDPQVAVTRALAEHQQFLPATRGSRVGATDGASPIGDSVQQHWWDTATLDEHPYVGADPRRSPTTVSSLGVPVAELADGCNVGAVVHVLRARLEAVGLRLLVADMTRPDIGLPVVKVVVPGLRHFWPRLGPGRLYDVPVALGRLPHANREADLNPEPLCL